MRRGHRRRPSGRRPRGYPVSSRSTRPGAPTGRRVARLGGRPDEAFERGRAQIVGPATPGEGPESVESIATDLAMMADDQGQVTSSAAEQAEPAPARPLTQRPGPQGDDQPDPRLEPDARRPDDVDGRQLPRPDHDRPLPLAGGLRGVRLRPVDRGPGPDADHVRARPGRVALPVDLRRARRLRPAAGHDRHGLRDDPGARGRPRSSRSTCSRA